MNELAETRLALLDHCHGKTGRLPPALLVEQVLTHHGETPWAVKREAMAAILRRLASGQREGLKIADRPRGGEPLGLYRTRRSRAARRPYGARWGSASICWWCSPSSRRDPAG